MTVDIQFSIWLASKTQSAQLIKTVPMPAIPRVGEFVKFRNREQGDYFAWKITQVTYYQESGTIDVWTEMLNNIEDRGYSFETEQEFSEYVESYLSEGWRCDRGVGPNRRYKGGTGPLATNT